MKQNITLSAEQGIIDAARKRANAEGTSLNQVFRRWISAYAQSNVSQESYNQLMSRLIHAAPGKTFTRDELNER